MASQTPHMFTEAGARRIVATVRIVEAQRRTPPSSPVRRVPEPDAWLKLTASAVDTVNVWNYTADLYANRTATSPIQTGVTALNSWEEGNDGSNAGGYEIGGDDHVSGLRPAALTKFYAVVARDVSDGSITFYFDHKNDPEIDCED